MTAPVRIDASAWGDLRFATLARLCGFADAEHALIKCAKIWSWQTEHYCDDEPTYVVEIDLVESALGPGGADHLVRARLAEAGPDGLRIRGSRGRIEWLWKTRTASKRGGDATRRKHADKTGPRGQPAAMPEAGPVPRQETGPLIPDPDLGSLKSLPPRGEGLSSFEIAGEMWAAVSAARIEIAAELKLANVIPLPARFGMPSEPRGCRELRDRVREEGEHAEDACGHILANLIAQAREDRDVEWLSEKAFTAGGWQTARNWIAGQRKRAQPRGSRGNGVIGAGTPRTDHGTESRPAREVL